MQKAGVAFWFVFFRTCSALVLLYFLALILACCTFVCFCSHFPWASIWGFTFQELFCAFSLHYFWNSKASRISWTLPLKTKRKTECILFSLFFFILKDMLNMDAFAGKLVPPSQNGPYWPFRVFLTSSQSGRQKRFKTKQVNKKSIESETQKPSRHPESLSFAQLHHRSEIQAHWLQACRLDSLIQAQGLQRFLVFYLCSAHCNQ